VVASAAGFSVDIGPNGEICQLRWVPSREGLGAKIISILLEDGQARPTVVLLKQDGTFSVVKHGDPRVPGINKGEATVDPDGGIRIDEHQIIAGGQIYGAAFEI
jgi:hypothetical protein